MVKNSSEIFQFLKVDVLNASAKNRNRNTKQFHFAVSMYEWFGGISKTRTAGKSESFLDLVYDNFSVWVVESKISGGV